MKSEQVGEPLVLAAAPVVARPFESVGAAAPVVASALRMKTEQVETPTLARPVETHTERVRTVVTRVVRTRKAVEVSDPYFSHE